MRSGLVTGVLAAVVASTWLSASPSSAGETLYNGIKLPDKWPPRIERLTLERAMPVPYLASPPKVIPIDVGRQLFVDDFLIEVTTLTRTFHKARVHPASPVVKPDRPWELKHRDEDPPGNVAAMVFSDGVWFDPEDNRFKMWYMAGYCLARAYAISEDGIHWEKPSLDVVPGTNIVHPIVGDTATVWLDLEEKNPAKRFKMFREGGKPGVAVYVSPDGIHWSDEVARSGATESPTTVFYNPFRNVWVYSIRHSVGELGRYRRYWETPDPAKGIGWNPRDTPLWVAADRLDPPHPGIGAQPQIYNLDAVAYESVMLGLFSMWRGDSAGRPKIKDIALGFSRDGFHWDRPWREPVIAVSDKPGDWNYGNLQSAGGGCLVVGDELYFYVSGRAGVSGTRQSGACSTGLAVLRRDGFASMDADKSGGTLVTRPLTFRGGHLFVNADASGGELTAEVLDADGAVLEPFSRDNCDPVNADGTLIPVRWQGLTDLSSLAGKVVRFRFWLKSARLYSFWVSPDESGASHGYVAAGGPGFKGPTDTVGRRGYGRRRTGPSASSGSGETAASASNASFRRASVATRSYP